jgi:hypothetical protein
MGCLVVATIEVVERAGIHANPLGLNLRASR